MRLACIETVCTKFLLHKFRTSIDDPTVVNSQVGTSLKFYVLQDAHGRVQLVIKPSENSSTPLSSLDNVPLQSVVVVQGAVSLRRGSAIRRDVSATSLGKVFN